MKGEGQKVQGEGRKVKGEGQKVKGEGRKVAVAAAFAVGDTVRMKAQQTVGKVAVAKDDYFVVAFGAVKTIVRAEQLEKVQGANPPSSASIPSPAPVLSNGKLNFKLEIDVRGMRGEEALQAVMYYIDDAVRYNAGRVRILHGTGTGALRQIIREYLKTAPGVKHFQDEHVQFGGAGITVVELL